MKTMEALMKAARSPIVVLSCRNVIVENSRADVDKLFAIMTDSGDGDGWTGFEDEIIADVEQAFPGHKVHVTAEENHVTLTISGRKLNTTVTMEET